MDLKTDYNKLYQHWFKEVQDLELTTLSQDLFEEYRISINSIDNYKLKSENKIQLEILQSYKENFQYLFTDFLKLREIKIINAALALQEIDFKRVIEAEKLFFQNLVSSIKGFKKLRELSIHDDIKPIKIEEIIDVPETKQQEISLSKNEINDFQEEKIISEINIDENNSVDSEDKEIYDYTLIRFLKKTPPLVGIDLKNYGPFEKENIALIPYKNAKILLSEKFAETIDISS